MINPPKLTRNQSLVYDSLTRAGAPLGAYAILEALRTKGFKAPLQVYRALDKLQEVGMVHRLESVNAFVACQDDNCQNAAQVVFAICDDCGNVAEFADTVIAGRLQDWASENSFHATRSSVEIHGKCARCQA